MSELELTKISDTEFRIKGVLMMHTVMSIIKDLSNNLKSQSEIRIDFSAVENSDSAAVALIISWLSTAKQMNIKIHLVNLPQQILDIAKASDLLEILPID